MNDIERQIASKLVADALTADYRVSVYDGEEWCLRISTSHEAIMSALGSTDMDTLSFVKSDYTKIGRVLLIWGNGTDLLSDWTDNTETYDILAGARELSDKLAEAEQHAAAAKFVRNNPEAR